MSQLLIVAFPNYGHEPKLSSDGLPPLMQIISRIRSHRDAIELSQASSGQMPFWKRPKNAGKGSTVTASS